MYRAFFSNPKIIFLRVKCCEIKYLYLSELYYMYLPYELFLCRKKLRNFQTLACKTKNFHAILDGCVISFTFYFIFFIKRSLQFLRAQTENEQVNLLESIKL